MRKVTVIQRYEITLGDECDNLSKEQLISDINGLYDYRGNKSVIEMGIKQEYLETQIEAIDDDEIMKDFDTNGNEIISNNSGTPVILDGNKIDNENIEPRG